MTDRRCFGAVRRRRIRRRPRRAPTAAQFTRAAMRRGLPRARAPRPAASAAAAEPRRPGALQHHAARYARCRRAEPARCGATIGATLLEQAERRNGCWIDGSDPLRRRGSPEPNSIDAWIRTCDRADVARRRLGAPMSCEQTGPPRASTGERERKGRQMADRHQDQGNDHGDRHRDHQQCRPHQPGDRRRRRRHLRRRAAGDPVGARDRQWRQPPRPRGRPASRRDRPSARSRWTRPRA